MPKDKLHWEAIRKAIKIVSTFFVGQGALQFLNIITGLFLIRALSMEAYAQYSLALAFQNTAITLTSLGLTDSIVPLVGSRTDDRKLIGRYVLSVQHLRGRLFLAIAPFTALLFHFTARSHNWTVSAQLILLISILTALYCSVAVSSYSAPLIIKHRLYDYYFSQIVPGFARLCSYAAAHILHMLGSGLASIIGSATVLLNGLLAKRRGADLIELPLHTDKATDREVVRCMLPMMPASIFAAFQPQIALFLISIFGQTIQIAQVAALSRIASVFLIFNAFNSLVLEPYIARVPSERLLGTVTRTIALAVLSGTLLTLFSFAFPSVVLMLFGSNYADLDKVVSWVVLSSSMTTVANVMWVINRGRKWLFWRLSFLEIGGLIIFQAGFVILFGVRTTLNAALFMLAASCAHLVSHGYIIVYGLLKHRDSQRA